MARLEIVIHFATNSSFAQAPNYVGSDAPLIKSSSGVAGWLTILDGIPHLPDVPGDVDLIGRHRGDMTQTCEPPAGRQEFHFQISVIARRPTVEPSRFADKTSAAR